MLPNPSPPAPDSDLPVGGCCDLVLLWEARPGEGALGPPWTWSLTDPASEQGAPDPLCADGETEDSSLPETTQQTGDN